ncbi:MAG: hypothetical protein HY078_12270 [Elusimicrobia bacterium]|nr:hypothetical protein [Elusimicrobiota bacterium]
MSVRKGGVCWNCAGTLEAGEYRRGESCGNCRFDTRSCRNCELYDPNFNNHCRESAAEPVANKESSNFCEYFQPNAKPKGAGSTARTPGAGKAAFDALFKKKD